EGTRMLGRLTRRVTTMMITLLAVLAVSGTSAFAQSSGSGGGSFSNAYLIPTIVCSAGSFDPSTLTCDKAGGGAKVLFGNIKTPTGTNKNVLVMATLESSILTNTVVASNSGASGALVDITSIGGTVDSEPGHVQPADADAVGEPAGPQLHAEHVRRAHVHG